MPNEAGSIQREEKETNSKLAEPDQEFLFIQRSEITYDDQVD